MTFNGSVIVHDDQSLLDCDDGLSSLFGPEFRNEYGAIRWTKVRNQFRGNTIVLPDVLDIFEEWKDDPEYIVMRGTRDVIQERFSDSGTILDSQDLVYPEHVFRFVKASKRGNDVYRYLVNKKLKPLDDIPDVTFFRDDWGVKNTNLLFVTLTYDTNRCNETEAWENIGHDYHLFCNKMKQEYGHIEWFRTWESTGHYYPHVHVLIAFKDKSFPVLVHTGKDGHRSFRIPKHEKDKIASFWHSNVDVQGVDGTRDAIDELTKYVTKDLCSDKGNKTNAMICLFGRQSYGITGGFISLIENDFSAITEKRNLDDIEPHDLIKDEMCNCNNDFYKWEFVGVLRGLRLGLSAEVWVTDVKKPPPALIEMVIHEQKRWKANHPDSHGWGWG